MTIRRTTVAATALLSALVLSLTAGAASAGQSAQSMSERKDQGYTFAVIGDIPYGDAQIATFPQVIDQINADPDVRLVDHLGDIKSGSSVCSDGYFAMIRTQFDRFEDPLVYTPGDNEWTDCHRANNGSYNPLERLDAVRSTFFTSPGRTLGQHSQGVDSQSAQGYPENVRYRKEHVSFAAVHIVGSNNSLAPWTGNTTATPEQTAEVLGRTAAAVEQIHATFADAKRHRDRSVVLLTQADMFDPTVPAPTYADYFAFQPIVRAIAAESAAFGKPVYLLNGDSHVYNSDSPLAAGSPWLSLYGVTHPAANLTRVTVDGSTGVDNYLKVTIDQREPKVLRWARVPFVR